MSELPLLLSAKDIQMIFRLRTEAGARVLMARGRVGPRVRVGSRVYIRRDDFERALERQTERKRSSEK